MATYYDTICRMTQSKKSLGISDRYSYLLSKISSAALNGRLFCNVFLPQGSETISIFKKLCPEFKVEEIDKGYYRIMWEEK